RTGRSTVGRGRWLRLRQAAGSGAAASAAAATPAPLAGRTPGRRGRRGRPVGAMRRLVTAPVGPATRVDATAPVAEPTAARLEPRAALLGEPAALFGGRLDLGHEEVVVRPLHGDLLTDALLD